MRITLTASLTCVLTILLATATASAQEAAAGAPEDVFAQLRSRDVLSAADRDSLQQAIERQVETMAQAAADEDTKALVVARRNLADAPGQGASAVFRTTFAELAGPVVQPYLGIGQGPRGDHPRVALYLIQILGSLNQPSSLDTLLAALESRHPAVRYWAARAVRDMRSEIANRPGELVDRAMTALQQAGRNEGYPPAAQMMYQAVDFRAEAPGTGPRVMQAWLDMLEARLSLYNNKLVSEFYPDSDVLARLRQSPNLSDAEKARAVDIAYTIVRNCAQRWKDVARADEDLPIEPENPYEPYSVRQWHLRYQIARATQEAEALIREFSTAAAQKEQTPDVADLMINLSTADQVTSAVQGWQAILEQPAAATNPAPVAADATPAGS